MVPVGGTPMLRTVAGLKEPKDCVVRGLGARRGLGFDRALLRRAEAAAMAASQEATERIQRVGLMALCQRCSSRRGNRTGGGGVEGFGGREGRHLRG